MKIDSIGQFVQTLDLYNAEAHQQKCTRELTEKITEFLNSNGQYLHQKNIEIATKLESIAVRVKIDSPTNPLIEKIKVTVKELLPDKGDAKYQSIALLRRTENAWMQISEWGDLMEIPVEELPLSFYELFQILRSKVEGEIPAQFEFNSIGKIYKGLKEQDRQIFFAMVKARIAEAASDTISNISNFGIQDESALIEIAKLCAQKLGFATARLIKNFGIRDQQGLVDIAKLCIHQHGVELVRLLDNFGINDQQGLVEIAMFCAKEDAGETIQLIQKFRIIDQKKIVEIVKLCAIKDAKETVSQIRDLGIKDQAALVEIAKLCAQQNGEVTSALIKNFGIDNSDALVEIAKLCAQQNRGSTAQNIQNFGIHDQSALLELAKLCIDKRDCAIAPLIENFSIQDQLALIEIAKLCAQQNGEATAEFIQKFGIRDEKSIIEIAKLCAQDRGGCAAEYIQNFKINDQKALIEIAKLCAQAHRGSAKYIKNFKITDNLERIEIAKLCAQKNGGSTAQQIGNFEISDEKARIEIAKLCAQQDGGGTAEYIQNFRISDQQVLVEIAKLCAQQNGGGVAQEILNFSINDQKARIEIAKLCAQHEGGVTAEYIKNFRINDQQALLEIAKFCAQQNGETTAEFMQNFNIENHQEVLSLLIACIAQNADAIYKFENFTPLPDDWQAVFDHLDLLQMDVKVPEERALLFKAINELIDKLSCPEEAKEVIRNMCTAISSSNPHTQKSQAMWFLQTMFTMTALTSEANRWIVECKLLEDLYQLKDPHLKRLLTQGLPALAEDPNKREHFALIFSKTKSNKGLRLLAVPLFGLENQGVDSGLLDEVIQKINRYKLGSDGTKVKQLLYVIHLLDTTATMTASMKASALEQIFNKAQDAKQLMKNLAAAKGLLHLKETGWVESKEDLGESFRSCFAKLIPLEGFKNDAAERYDQTFGSCRNPQGLLTYAAGLKTLDDPEILPYLGRIVVSVFNGTFKEMRYNTEDNLHLARIYESRPDLKEKWETIDQLRLEQVITKDQEMGDAFDGAEWLRTKLLGDHHFEKVDQTFVVDYLNANDDTASNEVKKKLSQAMKNCAQGKNRKQLEQDKLYMNLQLQRACISLATIGKNDPITAHKKQLENIRLWLEKLHVVDEFVEDVKRTIQTLEQSPLKQSVEEMLDPMISDDPIDIMQAGTDVSGSCQRLDGSPSLNKGLLGYWGDGKNQLLCIKDKSGKITSRVMLKLLWDGEHPVLFREWFYPDTISTQERNALNSLAIKISKELNVPLTADDEGLEAYGKDLEALGGPAPWEYSDASGGVQKNGVYSIQNVQLIHSV